MFTGHKNVSFFLSFCLTNRVQHLDLSGVQKKKKKKGWAENLSSILERPT